MNFRDCSFQASKLTQGNIHASRIENLPIICGAIFIWVIASLSLFKTKPVHVLIQLFTFSHGVLYLIVSCDVV